MHTLNKCFIYLNVSWTTRNARKEYIVAKYAERRYVLRREEANPGRLYDAVRSRDITSLLQLYAEGADLAKPLTLPEGQVKMIYSRKCIWKTTFLAEKWPGFGFGVVINPLYPVTNLNSNTPTDVLHLAWMTATSWQGRPPSLFEAPHAFVRCFKSLWNFEKLQSQKFHSTLKRRRNLPLFLVPSRGVSESLNRNCQRQKNLSWNKRWNFTETDFFLWFKLGFYSERQQFTSILLL